MASGLVIHDTTRDKFSLGKIVIDNKDLLSSLHDNILGHILSFLPAIEAVRTSVLSKRWIHVWKSITSLRFDDAMLYSGKRIPKEHFINFVNNTLFLLSDSSIPNFSLGLSRYLYDPSQINAWISLILERGVRNLRIQYADKVLLSSNSLFNCSSLEHLVLQMRCTLSVPSSVCLPNLQYLSFSGIRLVSDPSTCSKDQTLSFPVLKAFEARGCEWSMQNVSIEVPQLQTFSVAFWNSLSNESSRSSINIYAPNLTDFSYEGDLEHEVILSSPSSIISASVVIVIDEDINDGIQEISTRAHLLLRQFHEVESLKLWFYKVPMHAKDVFTNLPAFGRLNYLQINEVAGEALLNLLHNSPILETLVLLHGVSKFDKDLLTSASVPHCFQSCLKVFQFGGFNVHEHELSLVKFAMANAAKLEKMIITTAFWLQYSDINMEKVKEQLLSFPKCSTSASLEFADVNGVLR
ncbi:F-box/FBD/LRR-repeat protein At3g14710-like [Neltuma alba]|uniref:F-box/FBD/LRR-repeat protein At3g14710-like n=1 Tax=Neltuma alba TaxID=207710 RepID=UPI0010A33E5A|nr:F-box/FBD/LRR-repeat protein At3g14710-like [Prosopis alba]XP_028787048.1 F-box/FBD/LRR-repeat protein At3g14710-like [Prosopis alba]XP_028787049.1 F-box/FBD/LRR-repeat protein At3g14710-like [Prosopis alba]XP_028787050.1 F-box/FBD/LRR-repeat protein At3g14710-like [Prosopis alba]